MESFIVEIYQEATPNPESLKFTTNLNILPNFQIEFKSKNAVNGESLLADALFELPFVQSVFLSQNFVTITKTATADWYEITPQIKKAIEEFHNSGKALVSDNLRKRGEFNPANDTDAAVSVEEKITALLDKYVRPAVEMDGGYIAFHSFDNGIVNLTMHGSCSGCPSSQITLRAGIEGLLKRMIPEVKEVVAVEE
ncbi:MAG: NifU family protein [Chitinophagales bacterium]|nr:NifU family protein [Chitinophagales bacterium]